MKICHILANIFPIKTSYNGGGELTPIVQEWYLGKKCQIWGNKSQRQGSVRCLTVETHPVP